MFPSSAELIDPVPPGVNGTSEGVFWRKMRDVVGFDE